MNRNFAVKAKSFELYEAFKNECERIGFIYNQDFNAFEADQIKYCNCLFFSRMWNCKEVPFCGFAFSNTDNGPIFHLETQFVEAAQYAKKYFEKFKPKRVRISRSKIAKRYGVPVENVIIVD